MKKCWASASQGDKDAFGVLYERYVDRIFNYVYYRTGNLHDAEDLTARVFQRAMNHIHNYTDRGVPFSAWLYRIAHNLVANWHRDRSRKQEIPINDLPVLPSRGDHPETTLVHSQDQDSLLRLIRRLPADRQTPADPEVCGGHVECGDRADHGTQRRRSQEPLPPHPAGACATRSATSRSRSKETEPCCES